MVFVRRHNYIVRPLDTHGPLRNSSVSESGLPQSSEGPAGCNIAHEGQGEAYDEAVHHLGRDLLRVSPVWRSWVAISYAWRHGATVSPVYRNRISTSLRASPRLSPLWPADEEGLGSC